MRYSVDVKAFLRVDVEADSPTAAEAEAKAFVEGLGPQLGYLDGWQSERKSDARVTGHGSLDCEDPAHIEDEDGNEVEPDA